MSIVVCFNCLGMMRVWNGRRFIACPTCGNRGMLERVEQLRFDGQSEISHHKINPDRKVKYAKNHSHDC